MRDTSLLSYLDIVNAPNFISEAQKNIFRAIHDLVEGTDQEIKVHLGFNDPNKVRPRRKELLDLGLIVDCGTRLCGVTGRTVHSWAINVKTEVMSLKTKEPAIIDYDRGRRIAMIEEKYTETESDAK